MGLRNVGAMSEMMLSGCLNHTRATGFSYIIAGACLSLSAWEEEEGETLQRLFAHVSRIPRHQELPNSLGHLQKKKKGRRLTPRRPWGPDSDKCLTAVAVVADGGGFQDRKWARQGRD